MNDKLPPNDPTINQTAREIWNEIADFWDERMGEGNSFHKTLIEPTQLALLELVGGEEVLDLACGNGQFARKMADFDARVTAVDGAPRMLECARQRSARYEDKINFQFVDCTDAGQLHALGENRFDRVVCTMALMDIPDIVPLAHAARRLLKPDGCLVFSQLHPCFNSGLAKQAMERSDIGGKLVEDYFVKVTQYLRPATTQGVAMAGQHTPHFYFHRSLADLLQTFFAAGFILDRLAEPAFGDRANPQKMFEMVYQEIPPALVVRLRPSE